MSEGHHSTRTVAAAGYPHHRDCVKCGYDIFAQPLDGRCPECGIHVATTALQPLWAATHRRALERSRWALLLFAFSAFAIPLLLSASLLSKSLPHAESNRDENISLLLTAVVIATGLAAFSALVLLGLGVSVSARTRWMPLLVTAAIVGWEEFGQHHVAQGSLLFVGTGVSLTLFWILGVAIERSIHGVASGLPSLAASTRTRRFLKLTATLLLVPAIVAWIGAGLFAFQAEASFRHLKWLLYYGIPAVYAIVAIWLIFAAVHWLRLLRFFSPPRTLPP